MATWEIIAVVVSGTFAVGTLWYVRHLVRVSGRDQPCDPELVRRFVESAPMDDLERVLRGPEEPHTDTSN